MDAEGFVIKRALWDGWECLWSWSKVVKTHNQSCSFQTSSHVVSSLENMEHPDMRLSGPSARALPLVSLYELAKHSPYPIAMALRGQVGSGGGGLTKTLLCQPAADGDLGHPASPSPAAPQLGCTLALERRLLPSPHPEFALGNKKRCPSSRAPLLGEPRESSSSLDGESSQIPAKALHAHSLASKLVG